MGAGSIDPVFVAVLGIIMFLVLIADLVIFCYWFSFKYKEYSFQQMYGPILKFPPRESHQPTETLADQPRIVESDSVSAPDAQRPTPNTEYPIPDDLTPGTENRTPVSGPTFDFLPTTTSEEGAESVSSDEPTTPNAQRPTPDAQSPTPNADLIPDAQRPTPNASSDAFEDARPIDPVLLSAQGGVRSPFAATWSLAHPFIGIQFVLIVVSILQVIFLLPAMFTSGPNAMTSPYGLAIIIVTLFIQNAGFVGITAYLVKGYGTSLKRIGLRAPTSREIGLGLIYGAGLCLAAVLMEKALDAGASHFVSKQFMDRMGKLNDAVTAGAQFEKIRSVPLQIWFILAGAVAAPIGEEVFFRGLLYNGLKKRWGVAAGVIVSGICFGLIHFSPEAIIIIIPMGCILAMVYERTKSLWVTILMHAVNNGAQLIIAMYAMNHLAGHK